jgi:hypothetical protein
LLFFPFYTIKKHGLRRVIEMLKVILKIKLWHRPRATLLVVFASVIKAIQDIPQLILPAVLMTLKHIIPHD